MKRPLIHLFALIASAVLGCARSDNSGSPAPALEQPGLHVELVQKSWCRIEAAPRGGTLVHRLRFYQVESGVRRFYWDRLLVRTSIRSFRGRTPRPWQPTDAGTGALEAQVLADPARFRGAEWETQNRLFERDLRDRVQTGSPSRFEPGRALRVRGAGSGLAGLSGERELLFFPCLDFGTVLDQDPQPRPTIELNLEILGALAPDASSTPRFFTPTAPLQVYGFTDQTPAQAWCSWVTPEKGEWALTVLTLGRSEARVQSYPDSRVSSRRSESRVQRDIRELATKAQKFPRRYAADGALLGWDRLFYRAEDARGLSLLISVSGLDPDQMPAGPASYFFACEGAPPLEHHRGFRRHLPEILEAQGRETL